MAQPTSNQQPDHRVAVSVKPLSLLMAITLFSASAQAAEFRYEGVEIDYQKSSVESEQLGDFDITGFGVQAMYAFAPQIIIGAQFGKASGSTTANLQGGAVDFDSSGPTIFGFFHNALSDTLHYQIGAAHDLSELEASQQGRQLDQLSDDDSSTYLIGGLRHQLTPKLQAQLDVRYDIDADSNEDEFAYSVTGRYTLSSDLDISLAFEPDDDGDTISVAVKKYFDFGN